MAFLISSSFAYVWLKLPSPLFFSLTFLVMLLIRRLVDLEQLDLDARRKKKDQRLRE